MTRRLMNSTTLLRNLTPTRTILGLTVVLLKSCSATIGISVSDPYLSHARPLSRSIPFVSHNDTISQLLKITRDEGAGAWVLSSPVLIHPADKNENHTRLRDDLVTLIIKSSYQNLLPSFCLSEVHPGTIESIQKEHAANIQWDSIDLSLLEEYNSFSSSIHVSVNPPVSGIHASVGLQMWLDFHCGGWQNTFG